MEFEPTTAMFERTKILVVHALDRTATMFGAHCLIKTFYGYEIMLSTISVKMFLRVSMDILKSIYVDLMPHAWAVYEDDISRRRYKSKYSCLFPSRACIQGD
jgi:hypothetical protein